MGQEELHIREALNTRVSHKNAQVNQSQCMYVLRFQTYASYYNTSLAIWE